MAKRRKSKLKSLFVAIICLVLGLGIGGVLGTYFSLPDSFAIPETKQSTSKTPATIGNINEDSIETANLSIHFLELGNKYTGDCVLVKSGDTEMLIDAGSKTSSIETIKNYIDEFCTDGKLEYVVVTHAHEDHYAGFATSNGTKCIFDYYEIGTIIEFAQTNKVVGRDKLYTNFVANVDRAVSDGATLLKANECVGNTYTLQSASDGAVETDVTFEILDQKYYYLENVADAKTENNFSVCLQITEGTKKYLFTGDLEEKGEKSLVELNSSKLSEVVLYKAGHHGSKTSSSETLLEVIKPQIVCVCACAGSSEYTSKNENQFPTQEFIDRVSIYTCKIFVTSLCVDYSADLFESFNGNIVVISTNLAVGVSCSNNNTYLKDTEWFKTNRTLPSEAVLE